MIVLIKLIVFLVQKLYYITKQSQELPRHSTALKFYVSVKRRQTFKLFDLNEDFPKFT